MNQTILHLQAKGLKSLSPLFSAFSSSHRVEFRMSKSSFSRSFSSIFHASQSPSLLQFMETRFDRILNSAICVNQVFNISDQVLTKMSPIDHDRCYIKRCTFNGCSSTGSGGAINYKHNEGDLEIINSVFYGDTCTDSGGAVFFSAAKYIFMQVCAEECKAGSSGMTFYIQPTSDMESFINYSMSSICAPKTTQSSQYNLHHNGGFVGYYNDNITRGLVGRTGAAIGCLRTIIHNIFYSNICSCKGATIISIEFGRESTEFKHCNIYNNTHTQSQILTFSQSTQLTECILVGNKRPFTSPIVTGKRYSITFEKCAYDAIGVESKNEIVINDHRDFSEDNDKTHSYQVQRLAVCGIKKGIIVKFWEGINIVYIILVTLGITLAHIVFIHPNVIFDLYYNTFFDSKRAERRRRAHPINTP